MPDQRSAQHRLMVIAVLALVLQCSGCADSPVTRKGQRMRIELPQVSFEIPDGFQDWTNYSFKDSGDSQVLTVSGGARPAEAADLPALLAGKKSEMEHLMPGAATLEGEIDGRIGQWPARLLTFSVADRKRRFREHWAVAFDTPKTYIQISYATPSEDAGAADRFAHILRSVAARLDSSQSGFARRWAGVFYLDVPTNLAPPRTYQFTTGDEATHLALTAYDHVEPAHPEPTLEQEAAEDERKGTVSDKRSATFAIGPTEGSSLTYALESEMPDGNIREVCRRILVRLGDSIHVHLFGRARLEAAAGLAQTMDAWLRTFQRSR